MLLAGLTYVRVGGHSDCVSHDGVHFIQFVSPDNERTFALFASFHHVHTATVSVDRMLSSVPVVDDHFDDLESQDKSDVRYQASLTIIWCVANAINDEECSAVRTLSEV